MSLYCNVFAKNYHIFAFILGRLTTHTSGTQTVMVITSPEDMITLLEESQVTIGTIKGSRYVTPIKVCIEMIKYLSY